MTDSQEKEPSSALKIFLTFWFVVALALAGYLMFFASPEEIESFSDAMRLIGIN